MKPQEYLDSFRDALGRPADRELIGDYADIARRYVGVIRKNVAGHLRRKEWREAAEKLMGTAGELAAQSPGRKHWQCAPGCGYCCEVPVSVAGVEALLIGAILRDQLPAEELALVRQDLATNATRAEGKDAHEYIRERIRCTFLAEDNTCAIYNGRPSSCRAYASFDRESCRSFLRDPGAGGVTVDSGAWILAAGAQAGFREAVFQAHLDGELYELHGAVLAALAPNAPEDWLAGRSPFKGVQKLA